MNTDTIFIPDYSVAVTDAPYCARGDGRTNDREAIQKAIDDTAAAGGGTVVLPAGKTFLSSPLTIRNHVNLHFEQDAVLQQSNDINAYVRPVNGTYESYTPILGHNFSETLKWSHVWYKNYPMIFAETGAHDFKITGDGTIYMSTTTDETLIKICPIGFYQASNFEISDVHITNYHSYAIMPFTCRNGLFRNLKIDNAVLGNGDGICLMNCQNIRITGCTMDTGDDSVYIFSSYNDPRGITWWSSALPQASENIEIDHNHLQSKHCKAFGMILWGIGCPDLEKVEVRNVYVHDNYFKTMGNWLWCPYVDNQNPPPVTHFRFENNEIEAIESNFFETVISDMNQFPSMREFHNGDFKDGRVFWSMKKNSHPASVGVVRRNDGYAYGYIDHLEDGEAALYQGLWLRNGCQCRFSARVSTADGTSARLFVRDLETGTLIASKDFSHSDMRIEHLDFKVPKAANYLIGIERGETAGGWARIDRAELLGNVEGAESCLKAVNVDENRKVIYFWKEDETYGFKD